MVTFSRSSGVFVSVTILLAAAVGTSGIAFSPHSNIGVPSSSSITSPSGIQLNLEVNSSSLQVGQELNIRISIVNTLPKTNIIKSSDDFRFQGIPVALWPPCYFVLPAQVVVLTGSYDLQGLHSVANRSFDYNCAEGSGVDHVVFQPHSNLVNITGIQDVMGEGNQTQGPLILSINFTTKGSWDLQSLANQLNKPIIGDGGIPPDSPPFVPGEYTIAVADEWGEVVIQHLTVFSKNECSTHVIFQPVPANFTSMPVLLMQPNTTGYVCVTYKAGWADNASQFTYYSDFFKDRLFYFPTSIYKGTCTAANQSFGCFFQESRSFVVKTFPTAILPSASVGYVTVVYQVTASSDSTGFYDHTFIMACESPRLAVGYSAPGVNSSDFSTIPVHSCPNQAYLPISIDVSGMDVTYVSVNTGRKS